MLFIFKLNNPTMTVNKQIQLLEKLSNKKVILTDRKDREEEVLNEGIKDFLTGVLLLSTGLTLNAAEKTQIIQNSKKSEVVQAAKEVLNDTVKFNTLVKDLKEKGLTDINGDTLSEREIQDKLKTNVKKLEDNLKEKDSKVFQKAANSENIGSYIKKGYVITKTQADTIYDTIYKENTPLLTQIEYNFNSNEMFKSGSFELSQNVKDSLNSILQGIKNTNGLIVGVKIESSTDKQRVGSVTSNKLQTAGYQRDNKGLSSARNNSIGSELLKSGIVDSSIIKKIEKVEQGNEIDQSARYVKVSFTVQDMNDFNPEIKTIEELVKYQYTVAKSTKKQNSKDFSSNVKANVKTGKLNVKKLKPGDCPKGF